MKIDSRFDIIDFILIAALCFISWVFGMVTTLAIQDTIKRNEVEAVIAQGPSVEVTP